ncbi:hypothetical protein [Micromonospora sp. SH-82]|uniref:hypothetical protein n=1 Tax=Micromonospora sp. SH-82 TaxID=3132938 RepID=UPI003EBA3FE8
MTTWQVGPDGAVDRPGGYGVGQRPGAGATVVERPALDYYLVHPPGGPGAGRPVGLLVEEFVFGDDHAAVRLDGVGWTAGERRWWDSAAFSRAIRADRRVRERVVPVDRSAAEAVHRGSGGDDLPDEATLRGHFGAGVALPAAAPLRLGDEVTDGYRDTRVYRVLFANALSWDGLARLQTRWRMTIAEDAADPRARVVGTSHLRVGADAYTWQVRRVAGGAAWCLDVTVDLASNGDDTVRPLLRSLTAAMRAQGLIPVTVERFS